MSGAFIATSRGRQPVPALIAQGRVIAIARNLDASRVVEIGEALRDGGIRAFEVALNSPSALEAITALRQRFAPEEFLIGAGTVLDLEQAKQAVDAGAQFIVMPHLDVAIVEWAVARDLPSFPGGFSPTEILTAWRAGAAAVKLFPSSTAGPAFVREMRGPLPQIPLIPTGGVTLENAPAFLQAGAVAVAMGSWLTGGGDTDQIRERASAVAASVAAGGDNR